MFLIRNIGIEDLNDLYQLSQLEHLINLPRDKKQLRDRIQNSLQSFKKPNDNKALNYYLFVLEDLTKSKIIGISMIHGQHGTEKHPHFFFRVYKEQKRCSALKTEFTHTILELDYEPNGCSEIGGLILHPDYRGRAGKLGKQLSFCRFLYMALYPQRFTDTIHTELLPPLNPQGSPPLWEAIGKKFTQMSYDEADRLSRLNKEFIIELFPWKDKIYGSLLPPEALETIGKVSPGTQAVKSMLEKIGFQYMNEVDPFDGGPHYRCARNQILPVKQSRRVKIQHSDTFEDAQSYLIQIARDQYDFCCQYVEGKVDQNRLYVPKPLAKQYDITNGLETVCIPM